MACRHTVFSSWLHGTAKSKCLSGTTVDLCLWGEYSTNQVHALTNIRKEPDDILVVSLMMLHYFCFCSFCYSLLDFYGNNYDPRTTGISVRTRQYFFRSQDAHSLQNFRDVQGWVTPNQNQFPDMTMRTSSPQQNRFQPSNIQFGFAHSSTSQKQQFPAGKFDPIWVEDPLNIGNNVGRNAFRIFQVQRAFSDAHRALVASLEWDINSTNEFDDDGEYPLLKCLLQNEDVFFSIEDNTIIRN